MSTRKTSRRSFLGHSCRLGVASATLGTSMLSLGMAQRAAAAPTGDYRALVCVLLAGGNDSFNMLVPLDSDQYGEYAGIRSDLALPQGDLLPLNGTTAAGRSYGVHPGMSALQSLYNNGDAAMIANVGTLLEPFDPIAVDNGSAELPVGLFSHADQIAQWQTAAPDARLAQGWAGRIADLIDTDPSPGRVSMNISLAGSNVFQSGNQSDSYSVESGPDAAPAIAGYDDVGGFGDIRRRMIDELLAVEQTHLLKREYRDRLRGSIDTRASFITALATSPALATTFGADPFGASLRRVAEIIGAREALGVSRQTFFVLVGGWDHHDDVIDNQAAMLPAVANGLASFRDALVELGVFDAVTTFTTSDFGRTLTSNGKGSDHGWGGHHIAMGGCVQGGQIVGTYPELSMSSPLDVGRGIYAPTTPVDAYFGELASWFGVAPADFDYVLPNARRFISPETEPRPLGFLV